MVHALLCAVALTGLCYQGEGSRERTPDDALVAAVSSNDVIAVRRALAMGAAPDAEFVWTGLINIDEPHQFRAPVLLKALDWNAPVSGCLLGIQLDGCREAHANDSLVRALLDGGASANARQPGGGSALEFALSHCSGFIVRNLLAHGAEIVNHPGEAPYLTIAAAACRPENVRALLSKGASVNSRDSRGRTSLLAVAASMACDLSAGRNQTGTAATLLDNGAEVNAVDNEGVTALMLAACYHRTALVRLLLDRGANPISRDKGNRKLMSFPGGAIEIPRKSSGRTALDYAEGYPPIQLLLRRATHQPDRSQCCRPTNSISCK
jgi:ankyrin repeat protein